MTDQNNVLAAALAYAARGVPVFPCNPSPKKGVGKRPLVAAESSPGARDGGLYLATTSEAKIREWWRKWPLALIGVPTGSTCGAFVVDLDPDAFVVGDMLAALELWCGGLAEPDPETGEILAPRISATPSGGLHLWYALPALNDDERIGNRANLFAKAADAPKSISSHVDVRGNGGYVIAPPSRLNGGGAYLWRGGPDRDHLPQAPSRLIDLIMRRGEFGRMASRPVERLTPDVFASEAVRKYALAALDMETRALAGCMSGGRNNQLNIAAVSLGALVGAGALSESVVAASLEGAAEQCGLVAEDGWESVRKTIQSGLSYGKNNPRDLSDIERKARERADRNGNRHSAARARPPDTPPKSDQPPAPTGGLSDCLPSSPAKAAAKNSQMGGVSSRSGGAGGLDLKLSLLPTTDLGNAKRFLERFGRDFVFVREWGWLAWDKKRWSRTKAEGLLEDAIKSTVEAIVDEVAALAQSGDDIAIGVRRKREVLASEELADWAQTSQAAGHINCLRNLVQSDCEQPVHVFDADPFCINVNNGTLRISKHDNDPYVQLSSHNRDDFITKIAPVDYVPGALCPQFDKFLDRVQADKLQNGVKPVQRFLDQWGGLSLTGDATEQKLAFFHGRGRNGKSVWVDTVAFVAGDYAKSVPIETFLEQGRGRNAGAATPDLAMLPGVRFLRTSEPEKNAKLAEALIKLVTGGEAIDARQLNQPYFSFKPQFKLTIQGNYRPRIDGTDEGIWERVMLVPWKEYIPKNERDLRLAIKLQAEASGILNRLLSGLCDWLDNGLYIPDEVAAATESFRNDSDPLGRFLKACTAHVIGAQVQSSDMHRVFCAWARANGEPEWTPQGLGRALRERGVPDKKSSVVYWLDIVLTKDIADFAIDPQPVAPPVYEAA